MEKILISVDELNSLITGAVENAFAVQRGNDTILISRRAAAKRLGVDVSTLWRWQKSSYIKMTKIGRSVWVSEAELRRIERGEREV